ncbi:MAG: EpsG family protein, partial [Flavobacteriaceae bacterium]|nr:EpsG family protein [Flavobacteriaceae bacterium]
LLAVITSMFVGNYFGELFASLNLDGDERFNNYLLVSPDESKFSSTGFRFDFLIYSFVPIVIWFFYYFKKKIQTDVLYRHLLNIYIVANMFWILLMYVNFANRFASLSWFLWPILVIYPLIENIGDRKSKKLAIKIIIIQTILSYIIQM